MWNIFFDYILPVLLGALIGYITNYLAIKMLFRPLRPVYIGRFKLPFTPGVFPRQRVQLAESLGDMVATQLMNQETISGYIGSDDIQKKIKDSIDTFSDQLLHNPISSHIKHISGSIDFTLFDGVIESFTRHLGETRLLSFLDSLDFDVLDESRGLSQESLEVFFTSVYKSISKQKLGSIIGDDQTRFIKEHGGLLVRNILALLFSWTDDPDVRERMNSEGQNLVKIVISRLNVFQQFLINVTSYDTSIQQNMPEIIDDVLKDLKKRSTNKDTLASMIDGLNQWLQLRQKHTVAAVLFSIGLKPELLIRDLAEYFSSLRGRRLIMDFLNEIKIKLSRVTLNSLKDSQLVQLISGAVKAVSADFFVSIGEMSITDLFILDNSHQKALNLFFYTYLATIIDDGVAGILEAFDVRALVISRVNSLSMEDIEALLLKLMKKQLSYINGLGAVLGALIGAVQLLL